MTATLSCCHTGRFSAARPQPVGRGEAGSFAGLHRRQPVENVLKVFLGVDTQAAAVFNNGVEDRGLLAGRFGTYEHPVARTKLCWADGVFDSVIVYLDPAVAQINFEALPLVERIADGFAKQALGQDRTAESEKIEQLLESAVDRTTLGGAGGFAQGGADLGLPEFCLNVIEVTDLAQDPADEPGRLLAGFKKLPPDMGVAPHEFDPGLVLGPRGVRAVAVALDDACERIGVNVSRHAVTEQLGDGAAVAPVAPVVEHAPARYVRHPEVAGLGFAAAGFEVIDGGFVNLSVKCAPMFVLDFSVNNGDPIGSEQRPVAESLAVKVDSHAGEHFLLTVVGQMAHETVVHHFGDESGSGDAAVLKARRQRVDERLGGGIILAHVFASHELDADELGGLEVELLAHFLADAAEGFGVEPHFGRIKLFAHHGQVIWDARGAGFCNRFLVGGYLSRRSWVCGSGGGGFFCEVAPEHEFELGGIELFARYAKDASGQCVDGLTQHQDLCGLARNLI